ADGRVAQERAVVRPGRKHVARARADRDHHVLAFARIERIDGDHRAIGAVDGDDEQPSPGEPRRFARGPHFADDAAADHLDRLVRRRRAADEGERARAAIGGELDLIDDGADRGLDRHRRGAERAARRIAHAHDHVLADAGTDRIDGHEVRDLVRRRVPEVGLDHEQLAPVEGRVLLGGPDFADDPPEDHGASTPSTIAMITSLSATVSPTVRSRTRVPCATSTRSPSPAPSRSIAVTRPPRPSSTTSSFAPSSPSACLAPQTDPTTRPSLTRLGGLLLAALFGGLDHVEEPRRRHRLELLDIGRVFGAPERRAHGLGELLDRAVLRLDLAADLVEADELLVRRREQARLHRVLVLFGLGDRAEDRDDAVDQLLLALVLVLLPGEWGLLRGHGRFAPAS